MSLYVSVVDRLECAQDKSVALVCFERVDDRGGKGQHPAIPETFVVPMNRDHSLTFRIGEVYYFGELYADPKERAAFGPRGKAKGKAEQDAPPPAGEKAPKEKKGLAQRMKDALS